MTVENEMKILEEINKEIIKKGRLLYSYEIREILDRFIVKYENDQLVPQDCSDCKRYDSPYFEIKIDKEQLQELVDKAKAEVLASIERPQGEWGKWIIAEIQCPNCFEYFETDCYSTEELNKCPICGADMRKPNCVRCDHFGKCEGCEKRDEE